MAEKSEKPERQEKDVPKGPPARKPVAFKKTGKEKENFRGIIRIVGKDVNGYLTLQNALRRIPGVGHTMGSNLASILSTQTDIPLDEIVGNLTDVQLKKVEEVVKNPQTFGVPAYLLNRPLEPSEGVPKHLVMADLSFAVKNDIDTEKDIRTYR